MRHDQDPLGGARALIREQRVATGMTQRQLARAAGIGLGTLRDFEQGRTRSLRPRGLRQLSSILDLDLTQCQDSPLPDTGRIRIEVLGPLAVWRDRAQLMLGSARQRAVFGLLGLHWGTSLHRDAIIDALWGETPPASAVAEVQGYISRLRKLFAWDAGTKSDKLSIVTIGKSYQLTVDADQVDAAMFERLLRNARHAFAGKNYAHACALYERALNLWRGEVLGDIDLLRQQPAVTALSAKHSETVLAYATAARYAGAHQQVLPHLRALCAREPFNEQGHAHLMIALSANGQQASALRVFADMRCRLDQELGIAPSTVLAEAHIRVLRQQTGALP